MLAVGCATPRPQIVTRTVEVGVPVLFVERPPVVRRPELAISRLTPEQARDPGLLVQHYKASVQQLLAYARDLESIVAAYDRAADEAEKASPAPN